MTTGDNMKLKEKIQNKRKEIGVINDLIFTLKNLMILVPQVSAGGHANKEDFALALNDLIDNAYYGLDGLKLILKETSVKSD